MTWFLASLVGCTSTPEAAREERQAPNATAVRVEVVRLQSASAAQLSLSLPGEVEGSQDAVLSAALGGQVEAVLVQKGDPVRAGQVIARIDSDVYAAQVDQAEAQHAQAQSTLGRVERMGDLATPSQKVDAETAVKIAAAQVRIARAQLSRAMVTAPFTGVAADVYPSRGEFLGPGSPVARVVQLDPVVVTLSVSDRDVVGLHPDMEVSVRAGAVGAPLPGRIRHVGRAADLRTRSFPVDVELDNPDGAVLPGMIATVLLERSLPEGTLAIPQDWIVTRRDGQGVFVEQDGAARWTTVALGDVLHDQVVIREGLTAASRVIVTGQRDLVDGDAVLVAREGVCCTAGRAVFGGG
jgi:RND family efflux transporter MFP subunit